MHGSNVNPRRLVKNISAYVTLHDGIIKKVLRSLVRTNGLLFFVSLLSLQVGTSQHLNVFCSFLSIILALIQNWCSFSH
jgi:hypothetical protein